ncbi:MAG: hypothetical protein M0R49_02910 [Limnochordia bacterium]|nr:hypothetical protein [Limnochordia bacterium]
MLKKVILVFKTHFDIGFTDLASNVVEKYSNSMLEEVIATCNATEHMGKQRYVWTMSAWPLKITRENCSLELRRQLDLLIERGQIAWHALPFTSHTDFCSAEEYIESLRFGHELSQIYQKPYSASAKMTDVPGHSLMVPTILHGAGVRFLHIGCNEFAQPPHLPFLFRWRSLSGEQILTMYSAEGYGTPLHPPDDWNFPVWMALMHTHDNCGPQSASVIEEMIKRVQKKHPNAEVVCGTMDDFYHELIQCDLDDLPIIHKDLADTWIHGVGSYPKEVAIVRDEREKARRLQVFYARQALGASELKNDKVMALLDEYYENISLFEEHTWGADVKTWLGPNRVYEKEDFLAARSQANYQFMEASWQEQKSRAHQASAKRRELALLFEEDEEQGLCFFNPNHANFTGWVMLEELDIDLDTNDLTLDGQRLPLIKIHGQWACFVEKLAPLMTASLELAAKVAPAKTLVTQSDENGVLQAENHRYILTFSHQSGEILSLLDKKLNTVLLEKQGTRAVFSYQYDRYGIEEITEYLRDYAYRFSTWGVQDYGREGYPNCKRETYVPQFESYSVVDDTIIFNYRGRRESVEQYGDAQRVRLQVTLPPVGDEVFVTLDLINKQASPYVESGSFLFPFADAKEYQINKTNGVLNPATDIQRGANHTLYCLDHYLSAANDERGLCIVTSDAPLVSLGDTGIYTYKREFTEPEEPVAYFNLFNNMWGTNFPQWMGGDFCYRFTLFGYRQEQQAHLLSRASTLKQGIQLTTSRFTEHVADYPEYMQLINVRDREGSLVLRFADLLGQADVRKLRVLGHTLTPVDLHNNPVGLTRDDEIEFPVKPYGIYSFLLQKQSIRK